MMRDMYEQCEQKMQITNKRKQKKKKKKKNTGGHMQVTHDTHTKIIVILTIKDKIK